MKKGNMPGKSSEYCPFVFLSLLACKLVRKEGKKERNRKEKENQKKEKKAKVVYLMVVAAITLILACSERLVIA